MADQVPDERAPYADRINKLLRLAENTTNSAEAEAFTEKAQQLMIKYAITEELLARAEGRQLPDTIVRETITYSGIFHMALFDIGRNVARANNCKPLIIKGQGTKTNLVVIGFQSDVTNVKVLDASLQVQASTAMQRWYREQDVVGYTAMMKAKMRREFLFAFASGVLVKLNRANQAGVSQAVDDETRRTGDADTARKSTDLVLLSKKERVDEWIDKEYGSTLRTVRRNYSSGGYAARSAGYQAGMNANLGNPGVGGTRGQIERQ